MISPPSVSERANHRPCRSSAQYGARLAIKSTTRWLIDVTGELPDTRSRATRIDLLSTLAHSAQKESGCLPGHVAAAMFAPSATQRQCALIVLLTLEARQSPNADSQIRLNTQTFPRIHTDQGGVLWTVEQNSSAWMNRLLTSASGTRS